MQAEVAEVTGFWRELELPGLIDLHVHFMPDNVLSKVWAYFDAGREAGRPWPVRPAELIPRLVELEDRIVLGTDFPNIPYRYGHQLEALARLGLGDDWLRGVCWENPARLLVLDSHRAR